MALEISLAQFNRIASGEYNAGQIDVKTGPGGAAELVKINNHVYKTSKNNVQLAPERVLEIKEAFVAALREGGVKEADLKAIRDRLGLVTELSATGDQKALHDINAKRFTPLSRAEVRDILDKYANSGRGFTQASHDAVTYEDVQAAARAANASAKVAAKRDATNAAAPKVGNRDFDFRLTDAVSLLSTARSLKSLDDVRGKRVADGNLAEKSLRSATLRNAFSTLFGVALKMLPAGVRESETFNFLGLDAKIVKGEDGSLTAVVGAGASAAKVALGMDAQTFFDRLVGRAVEDMDTLGAQTMRGILEKVYDHDLDAGLLASDRTSLTRNFAALVIEHKNESVFGMLVKGDYNTGTLVEIAERAIAGEDVGDTKQALDDYHAKILKDNAGLPDDMKAMLEQVANIPLEKPENGELVVRQPIAAPINEVAAAIPPPPGPVPVVPRDIGGAEGIKNFVADLVFSDDTMVGDVVVNKPGETLRAALSDDKKLIAFAEILKNPSVLDAALAPEIAGAVKDGFAQIAKIIDAAWQKASGGETLAEAAAKPDFTGKFSLFFKDPDKLPGAEIAKFDAALQSMANKGCEQIQGFINTVFKVDAKNANAAGALTSDPYKDLSPEEIKAQLDKKSLNDILDSASTSDAPGQVGFFKQVISSYFTQLGKADKRSCFAAAMRYANTFDFAGKGAEEAESLRKDAINKFTGAVLKGTSPLLQKMMQGLPKEIMGDFADALADMKSHLAPIPRKIVQAHLKKMIDDSKGKIKDITVVKSLGAASVGEAFLCKFTHEITHPKQKMDPVKGDWVDVKDAQGNVVMVTEDRTEEFVVKIMRHDAERRVESEAKIFTDAAGKIPGMAKTWEGQLKQYMTEFDFRKEAENVKTGQTLYGVKDNPAHPMRAVAPNVTSMGLADFVEPQKNVMVATVARGKTADSFFKNKVQEIRNAAAVVFKQDPATGRILWQDGPAGSDGKPTKVPVIKDNLPAMSVSNLVMWLASNSDDLQTASRHILQATKAWFQEALMGSGKFHGDTHAGNLMMARKEVTFIDFGNLYQLKEREDGVNEKTELLRVIMGAAFRDKGFFLSGMEKLMSPEGRSALAANRAKAEAILDAVLDKSKGSFSFNIVYRLQAAVVELQKLGLELPPQINCFIQSMVRLSNAVTEINTIVNQTRALLNAANGIVHEKPQRDELDLVGQAFDIFASEEGHKVAGGGKDDENVVAAPLDDDDEVEAAAPKGVSGFQRAIRSERFGGTSKPTAPMFQPQGAYTQSVKARIAGAADPVAEARKLLAMAEQHGDRENSPQSAGILEMGDTGLATFETEYAAAKTPEEKDAAIQKMSKRLSWVQCSMLSALESGITLMDRVSVSAPKSFSSAVTDILFDNFSTPEVQGQFSAGDALTLGKDAYTIATGELGLGFFAALKSDNIIGAIQADGKALPSDNSYKIDIGV